MEVGHGLKIMESESTGTCTCPSASLCAAKLGVLGFLGFGGKSHPVFPRLLLLHMTISLLLAASCYALVPRFPRPLMPTSFGLLSLSASSDQNVSAAAVPICRYIITNITSRLDIAMSVIKC